MSYLLALQICGRYGSSILKSCLALHLASYTGNLYIYIQRPVISQLLPTILRSNRENVTLANQLCCQNRTNIFFCECCASAIFLTLSFIKSLIGLFLVQNDLVHGWGMDMKLGYCAQVRSKFTSSSWKCLLLAVIYDYIKLIFMVF